MNLSIIDLFCLGMRQEDMTATRYRNSLGSVFAIVETLMGGFGKRKFSLEIQYRHLSLMDSVQRSFASIFKKELIFLLNFLVHTSMKCEIRC